MSIASEILRLQNDSTAIASAITAKGVTVPSGSGYDDYATLIGQISTSGGGGTLPYDAQVEYISGTGTQYISTGITPVLGSTRIFLDCQFTDNYSTTQILVGFGDGGGQWVGNVSSYYGVGGGSTQKLNVQSSTRIPLIISWTSNKRLDISCGSSSAYSSATISSTNTLTLFCAANAYFCSAKIYACKIYNGPSLVLDLIPVRVGQVGKFYDTVNGTFYANAGSGSFGYGSDIS